MVWWKMVNVFGFSVHGFISFHLYFLSNVFVWFMFLVCVPPLARGISGSDGPRALWLILLSRLLYPQIHFFVGVGWDKILWGDRVPPWIIDDTD